MKNELSRISARREYEDSFTSYVAEFKTPHDAARHFRTHNYKQNGGHIFRIEVLRNGAIKPACKEFTDADFFEKCKHLMG